MKYDSNDFSNVSLKDVDRRRMDAGLYCKLTYNEPTFDMFDKGRYFCIHIITEQTSLVSDPV